MQTLYLDFKFNLKFTQFCVQKYNTIFKNCTHLLKIFFQCWRGFQPINCHFGYMFVKKLSLNWLHLLDFLRLLWSDYCKIFRSGMYAIKGVCAPFFVYQKALFLPCLGLLELLLDKRLPNAEERASTRQDRFL